eukprot:2567754-Rhodomonas_salina.2
MASKQATMSWTCAQHRAVQSRHVAAHAYRCTPRSRRRNCIPGTLCTASGKATFSKTMTCRQTSTSLETSWDHHTLMS